MQTDEKIIQEREGMVEKQVDEKREYGKDFLVERVYDTSCFVKLKRS